MDIKKKITIFVVYTVCLVALGAFLVPVKTKIETKTVVVQVDKSEENIKAYSHVTLKVTKKINKDGSILVTKVYVADRGIDSAKKEDKSSEVAKEYKKEVEKQAGYTTISVLAGTNLTSPIPLYGASINRDVLGPFGITVMGMSNGIVSAGVSVKF